MVTQEQSNLFFNMYSTDGEFVARREGPPDETGDYDTRNEWLKDGVHSDACQAVGDYPKAFDGATPEELTEDFWRRASL